MSDPATSFTIDDLFNLLARSGLLNDQLLEAKKAQYQSLNLKPKAVLQQMLMENLLTPFQAKQLSERRHRGFFLSEKYKILEFLGQGGMSRVLLCEHLMLQRLVAVKILNKSLDRFPGAAERFLREARASASMDHPNIARVFDVDRTILGPCIVMEFVDGVNLHELATKHGLLDCRRVAHYISQAATGLQHAHEAGLVHRDVKPANLVLDRAGTVKLLDLGLARYFDPTRSDNLTQQIDATSIIGTADYIAPEQVMESSSADIRADIYSLGYTMYFLLTQLLPAGTGPAMRKLLWHQTREPEPIRVVRPEVPEGLAAVLEKMIQKRPQDRYQTPAEVVRALAEWTSEPISEPSPEEMPKIKSGSYRLGLCPPPDPSKYTEISVAKPPARNTDPTFTGQDKQPAPEPPLRNVTDSSMARSESMIGYTNAGDVEAFASQKTNVRSADTNEVMSAALETSSTSGSSFIRGVSASEILGRQIDRSTFLALFGVFIAFCGGLLVNQWWSGRHGELHSQKSISGTESAAPDSTSTAEPDHSKGESTTVKPASVVLRGGGSTFIRPLMDTWSVQYEKLAGVKIEYSPAGSTKGIEGFMANFLDFGCSDAFLSDDQLADAGFEITHIPLAMGAVVPIYNLNGADGQPLALRFTGAILANIYLGKVKRWNDPAIVLSNPNRQLPDEPITVIYRKDGSGTTAIWTEYLSKANAAWKNQVGAGNKVSWPIGVGAEKSHGIADAISRTVGAIGYVELSYAVSSGLSMAQVMNQAGNYVEPSVDGITAAAAASLRNIPADLRYSLTDAPGTNAYPIVGTCWAVIRRNQSGERGAALVQFLKWATSDGQSSLANLQYGRLSNDLSERTSRVIDQITVSR